MSFPYKPPLNNNNNNNTPKAPYAKKSTSGMSKYPLDPNNNIIVPQQKTPSSLIITKKTALLSGCSKSVNSVALFIRK